MKSIKNPQKFLVIFLIIVVLVVNMTKISRGRRNNLYFIFKHPFISYDEKMKYLVGNFFYNYVLFIKENTPEDAKILIPPQGYPWPQTGNKGYLQYFLYPRYLVNGNEKDPGADLAKEGIDYVLLAWGESNESQYGFTNGWPKFNLKTKQIIHMVDVPEKKIAFGDYQYIPEQKNSWGIIELKNQ